MRFQLIEIEDLAAYPSFLRECQTDYLRWMMETFDVFVPAMPLLAEAMQQSGHYHLYDLCSGGGGSMRMVRNYMKKQGRSFRATLSDLYPNLRTFSLLKDETQGEIDYRAEPLNALDPPTEWKGFFTLFNAFHHFRPADARQILQNAADRNCPIALFEPIDKSIWQIIVNLLALTVLMALVTPFIRPFRWDRLFFTYLLPLIPFCTLWDGIVSVLRLYTPRDLQKMTSSIIGDYEWKTGKLSHRFGKVIYLIGIPKKNNF
jgi:hypothetical protein